MVKPAFTCVSARGRRLALSADAGEGVHMTTIVPADRQLAVDFAPPTLRPAFLTLLSLDARFAQIVRATREPMVGQMRLTWWRDALGRLDSEAAPAEPLLRDVQEHVLPTGIGGAEAATLIEGWEVLLDPLDAASIDSHGEHRGARLFALAGRLMPGDPETLAAAGRGWALADLAAHLTQAGAASIAADAARVAFHSAFSKTWPSTARPLGALALIQSLQLEGKRPLQNVLRMTRFRLTGR